MVNGKQVVGKWVIFACQRFLDDIDAAWAETSPWEFDAERADRPMRLAELPPTKSRPGRRRQAPSPVPAPPR